RPRRLRTGLRAARAAAPPAARLRAGLPVVLPEPARGLRRRLRSGPRPVSDPAPRGGGRRAAAARAGAAAPSSAAATPVAATNFAVRPFSGGSPHAENSPLDRPHHRRPRHPGDHRPVRSPVLILLSGIPSGHWDSV